MWISRRLAALAALGALLAPGSVRAQEADEEPGPETWYAQVLGRSDTELNVTHFWSKGPKLRSETVLGGRKIVTVVSGGELPEPSQPSRSFWKALKCPTPPM